MKNIINWIIAYITVFALIFTVRLIFQESKCEMTFLFVLVLLTRECKRYLDS